MDPQECWDQIVKSLKEAGELTNEAAAELARLEAIEQMHALAEWLESGGAVPEVD